jgi:hypothetical protein
MKGDRKIVVVSESRNNIITARTHPGLLGLQASVNAKSVITIEGHPWHSPEALALTCEAAGESVSLVDAGEHTERFDRKGIRGQGSGERSKKRSEAIAWRLHQHGPSRHAFA